MSNSFFAFPPNFSFKFSQKIKIVCGHLFFSCSPHPTFLYSPLLRVLGVRYLITGMNSRRQITPTTSAPINIDELEFTKLHFQLPNGFRTDGAVALPSLCSFHWKEEREKFEQLTVEIPAMEQQFGCRGCFINRYSFTPRKSYFEPPMLEFISSCKVFPSPSPSYERRLSHFIPCSISGRSIMLLTARETGKFRKEEPSELVLTTIGESSADVDYSHGEPSFSFRVAPEWLSDSRLCKLDYLSGAVIYTSEDNRGIKIVYPA